VSGRSENFRVKLPLLDRLLDDAPDHATEAALTAGEATRILRRSVRRDLEALLNARRRWRSWPTFCRELKVSPVGFGIPDFTSGAIHDPSSRELLRAEIEATIRAFEPRFSGVRVSLLENSDKLSATLRLQIEAMLRVEPAPEPIAFDTVLETTTSEVTVRVASDV
jgi:type VI secretion system protein ImpF